MEELTKQDITFFFETTGFDLTSFLQKYIDFYDSDYQQILAFYSGETIEANINSFNNLFDLISKVNSIIRLMEGNNSLFNSYQGWKILSYIEEIRTNLTSTRSLPKYLRSALLNNQYSLSPLANYSVQQGQTLEDVSRIVRESNDFDNDWSDIAIKNRLEEESYTTEGTNSIKIETGVANSIFVSSVFNSITPETILGNDIDRNLRFEGDDLATLDQDGTFLQSVDILLGLSKETNPQYPQLGWDKRFIAGQNLNSIAFPAFVRQLTETIRTDDTVSTVSVVRLEQVGTSVQLDLNITSIKGGIVQKQVLIG